MKQFTLKVAPRKGTGRGHSRRTRQQGRIPAILYGKLNEPQSLSLDGREFDRLLTSIAGSAAIIEVKESDDDIRLSVIQEIQRDPRTDRILHVDLHEVSADQEMETEVTVHVMGEAVGVRLENGILEIVSHEVAVRCLPKDLPSFIEVDVSELHVGGSIHVRELPQLPGVKYVDDPEQSVIACVEAAAEEGPATAPAGEAVAEAAAAPAAAEAAEEAKK